MSCIQSTPVTKDVLLFGFDFSYFFMIMTMTIGCYEIFGHVFSKLNVGKNVCVLYCNITVFIS